MKLHLLPPMLLCLMVAAEAAVPKETPTEKALATPSYLPPLARALLHKKMQRHGHDQTRLVLAVTLLKRDVVKAIATDISDEPRLVRPLPEARDELNSSLPEQFFVLQDALRLRAKDLAIAAEKKDDDGLAKAFGQLVETCVGCHSIYLSPP